MRSPRMLFVVLATLSALAACERRPASAQQDERARGKALLAAYGCAACHRIKGMDAPERFVGPPLERIGGNSYIAGVLPNNADALAQWLMAPRRISPGTAMPDLGVSAAEARAMAAYLYSQ